MIERQFLTFNELARNPVFNRRQIKKLRDMEPTQSNFSGSPLADLTSRAGLGTDGPTDGRKSSARYEVFWYWERDIQHVVIDRMFTLFSGPNPFREIPYVDFRHIPIKREFYGIGLVDSLGTMPRELNDLRNNVQDSVNLRVMIPFGVNRNAGVDVDDLQSLNPHAIVEMNDLNGIKAIEIPDIATTGLRQEAVMKADMDRASGVTDVIRGAATPALPETARGLLGLIAQSNFKFDHLSRRYIRQFNKFYKRAVLIMRLFMDGKRMVRIKRSSRVEYQSIDAGALMEEDFDITPNVAPAQGNNAALAAQIGQILPLLIQLEGQRGGRYNIPELVKILIKSLNLGIEHEIVRDDDEFEKMQAERDAKVQFRQTDREHQMLVTNGSMPNVSGTDDPEVHIRQHLTFQESFGAGLTQ